MNTRLATVTVPLVLVAASPVALHAAWPRDGIPVAAVPAEQSEPTLVLSEAGSSLLFWRDDRRGANEVYSLRVSATGHPAPGWPANGKPLDFGPSTTPPSAVPDGSGGAIVACYRQAAGRFAADVRVQRITSNGAIASGWPDSGRVLGTDGTAFRAPLSVTDGAGGAIVFWNELTQTGPGVRCQRILSSGSIAIGWPHGGVLLSSWPSGDDLIDAIGDGEGGALLLRGAGRQGDGEDLYLMRVTGAGTTAPGWPADGVRVLNYPGNYPGGSIATDGTGGAFVAWWDNRAGVPWVRITRVRGSGTYPPRWPPQGIALSASTRWELGPVIMSDGQGGALAAWTRYPSLGDASYSIMAQRIAGTADLAYGWPVGGLPIATGPETKFQPDIVADGEGGAFVCWTSTLPGPTTGSEGDIVAQRVHPDGAIAPGWPASGIVLCSASGNQTGGTMVSDPDRGAVATWNDQRTYGSTLTDVYAQRLLRDPLVPPVEAPSRVSATPNPASNVVRFGINLDQSTVIDAEVLDASGRVVRRLALARSMPSGPAYLTWDGRNEKGTVTRSGLYFVRVRGAGIEAVGRVAWLGAD